MLFEEPLDSGDLEVQWPVADVWSGKLEPGAEVPIGPAVVLTPLSPSGQLWIGDPQGGGNSGLRIDVEGFPPYIPPVGTHVVVTVTIDPWETAPSATLEDNDDVEVLGVSSEPVVSPWSEDAGLVNTLVEARVRITSPPDPLLRADTDAGFALDGLFGVRPASYGASGDLVGIVTEPTRVALRDDHDWTLTAVGTDRSYTTIDAIRAGEHPDGTWVQLDGVVQVSGWSRDGRYAVVQDADGDGLWVDAEGFGVGGSGAGDVVTWLGEVRRDGEGLRMRTWWDPVVTGSADPILRQGLVDGALVLRTVADLSGPDGFGTWMTGDGLYVDDRFVDLSDLYDPSEVEAVVRPGVLYPVSPPDP